MRKYQIQLTSEETALVDAIDLRVSHRNHDEAHAAYLANKLPILALLKSLSERGAIPEDRLNYWNDPDYVSDRRFKSSRKGFFERNGCVGKEIYTQPHFVPYLRYFLFGADLPDTVIAKFEKKVGNPNWITSGDIIPIGKFARDLARRHNLDRTSAPIEFFKLCLDMELGLDMAASVMRSVKRLR